MNNNIPSHPTQLTLISSGRRDAFDFRSDLSGFKGCSSRDDQGPRRFRIRHGGTQNSGISVASARRGKRRSQNHRGGLVSSLSLPPSKKFSCRHVDETPKLQFLLVAVFVQMWHGGFPLDQRSCDKYGSSEPVLYRLKCKVSPTLFFSRSPERS